VKDTYYKDNYPVARTEDDKWYTNTSKGQMYSKMLTESYGGDEEEGLKHFLQAYLACVAFVDEQVGLVLDALNESKFAKNTIVVLTSDHGWQMGEKQYLFKNSPWSSSTHIPMVIKAPLAKAGTKIHQPVSLIDIYPTLLDFCSLEGESQKNDNGFETGGFSLKSLVENPDQAWDGPEGVITAIATDMVDYDLKAQTFSYKTSNYRYILYPNGMEELYDVKKDPYEWDNMALDSRYDEKKTELRNKLLEMIQKN
jgi:iduronate 2-sulfatase